jgi:hypothetical protein
MTGMAPLLLDSGFAAIENAGVVPFAPSVGRLVLGLVRLIGQ